MPQPRQSKTPTGPRWSAYKAHLAALEAQRQRRAAQEATEVEAKNARAAELEKVVKIGSFHEVRERLGPKCATAFDAFVEDMKLCEFESDIGRYRKGVAAVSERLPDGSHGRSAVRR